MNAIPRLLPHVADLSAVSVIGFFSLPGDAVAEAQPDAYNQAMAEAGPYAGTCAHCGTGIRHHVIIETAEGDRAYIGTDCALRVGSEPVRRCVRDRLTAAELAKRDAERDARNAEFRAAEAARVAKCNAIAAQVKDLADRLADGRNGFCDSIAAGLRAGTFPTGRGLDLMIEILAKQAGRRGSKAYDAEWDRIAARLEALGVQVWG